MKIIHQIFSLNNCILLLVRVANLSVCPQRNFFIIFYWFTFYAINNLFNFRYCESVYQDKSSLSGMLLTRRCLCLFGTKISKKLEHYSQFQPSSLTIQQYLDFGRTGTVKTSFLFLRNELLVRLANIMQVRFLNTYLSL